MSNEKVLFKRPSTLKYEEVENHPKTKTKSIVHMSQLATVLQSHVPFNNTFIRHSGRKRIKNTVKYIQGHAANTRFAHSGNHQS